MFFLSLDVSYLYFILKDISLQLIIGNIDLESGLYGLWNWGGTGLAGVSDFLIWLWWALAVFHVRISSLVHGMTWTYL